MPLARLLLSLLCPYNPLHSLLSDLSFFSLKNNEDISANTSKKPNVNVTTVGGYVL